MTSLEVSVIPHVVERGNCIGCGMCAALCPAGSLEVAFDDRGFLVAGTTADPCTGCGICITVCPFAPEGTDEDEIGSALFAEVPGIKHDPTLGWWRESLVGAVDDADERRRSASGGLVTAVLKALLRDGHVDRVALVTPTGDPNALYGYALASSEDEISRGAGSAYYPVTMVGVLRQVLRDPAPTAFVALPCFAKALRLGAMRSAPLRESVTAVVGLVCGQTLGACASHYLASRAGLRAEDLRAVTFRHKSDADRSAHDFGIVLQTADDHARLSWRSAMAPAFAAGAFVPQACQFCDDVFAECADAAFMDAWLPGPVADRRGTSLVVARGGAVPTLLTESGTGLAACLKPVPVESVVLSQSGAVERKRRALALRLAEAPALGTRPPRKRVRTLTAVSRAQRYVWRRTWEFSRVSAELWTETGDYRAFDRAMQARLWTATALRTVLRYARALRRRLGAADGPS